MTDDTRNTAVATFEPSDKREREVIASELDDTLFVEASAGTGKTTSLVQRMVNLVVSGRTTMDRIAAITFTELAAAELRDRVRQELERSAAADGLQGPERELCRQGVSDLDQANIRTLHSFAGQLLHERPLEANLPPGFDTSDEVVARLAFDEEWEKWLDRNLGDHSPIAESISLLLTQGITLVKIKELAEELHASYADLQEPVTGREPPPAGAALGTLEDIWPRAEQLIQLCKVGEEDRLFDQVSMRRPTIEALRHVEPGTFQYYRQLGRLLPLGRWIGNQQNWDRDPVTGENACVALRDLFLEPQEAVVAELEAGKRRALDELVGSLTNFVLDYAGRRRVEGRAEFQDLLVWARDLLRDEIKVRDHFRQRFSHLLIDESQDTDPIQAEIAMFLAEDVSERTAGEERPTSWENIKPERGKLFVVGDPKQSIYRFRRADVEQMLHLRNRMAAGGGRTVNLVQNFRSQKPVVAWVNSLFGRWMGAEEEESSLNGGQAGYVEMAHRWSADIDSSVGPRVWSLGDEEEAQPAGEVRRAEAAGIAALLRQMVSEGWLRLDQAATNAAGREEYVPVAFSDICILIRSRTPLPALERALESADIPYRLESASLVFESQEVRDLLNCLRAIDNPADRVATVAALRSPAFGCSDVDLLRHHEAGGTFDYLSGNTGRGDPVVAEGLESLRQFHLRRMWERPGTLIERFVRDRMLLEGATSHPRMREQWRRYRFMVERAAQYAEAGGKSLGSFIGWIEDQVEERVQVTETPVPESDEESVRVMTMHSAKGLEFPVVVLTGINITPPKGLKAALFDRQRGAMEVSLGPEKGSISTPGYADLAEKEELMQGAEQVRLMYVAATRARDHLVLSLRRKEGEETTAHAISSYMAERPELWETVVLKGAAPQPAADHDGDDQAVVPRPVAREHTVEARDEWLAGRHELIANRGRPRFTSATALGQGKRQDQERKDEQEWGQGDEPWRRGRAGTQVGRAVHAVLQSINLATGEGLEERARAQATAEGIPNREDDVIRLSRIAVNHELVRRAVRSNRLWREVPVAAPVEGGFLHGFIDLLFEEPDGLVVVDYKTDSVDEDRVEEAVEKYRLQGGAYAYAVSRATGTRVKEVRFLYLEAETEVLLPDLDGAVREAEGRAKEELALPGTARTDQ
ncbi:MAG: UvrD-helicase domain-containing protein [Chloroflexota bacterium]|nr:UvrD-helicase domain-containing protein [Chloroflexota bacterium]